MRAANERVQSRLKPLRGKSSSSEIVCLVDDDPSIRKSVGRLLDSAGFKVQAFSEAKPFLKYLATNVVTVAVLDIWMEPMTGLELLIELYSKSPSTRVIFITGHQDPTAEAKVKAAGAFGFLTKPFDADLFLNMISRAFASAGA